MLLQLATSDAQALWMILLAQTGRGMNLELAAAGNSEVVRAELRP